MLTLFREQPRPFYMIFLLEVWERFGYYTVQGILTLYFVRHLGFSEEMAYYTYGAFFALVYGLVVVGGYLGDNILGTKRTIVLGLLVLALGYLSLALVSTKGVFWALGLVCVGNGLFKANPSSLLSKCYDEGDPRLYGGFTLYYMAVNLGSIVALLIGPAVSSRFGYPYAYFLSFIGILLGIANYCFQRQYLVDIHTEADDKAIAFWKWGLVFVGINITTLAAAYLLQHVLLARQLMWAITLLVVGMYFYSMRGESRASALRMLLAFLLMVEAVLFFILYQQMPTSLNLFAVNNVHPILFGIVIDPQSFQVLNPIWIVVMSPILAKVYKVLHFRGVCFPVAYKFALGMTFCGISFSLLYFARFVHDDVGMVSSWWLVASYLFQSTGELLVSALGVAMVAELVPKRMDGFVMGVWFLTSAVAGFIGASVATYTALPKQLLPGVSSLFIYTSAFAYIGLATLFVAVCMWAASPRLTKLMVLP